MHWVNERKHSSYRVLFFSTILLVLINPFLFIRRLKIILFSRLVQVISRVSAPVFSAGPLNSRTEGSHRHLGAINYVSETKNICMRWQTKISRKFATGLRLGERCQPVNIIVEPILPIVQISWKEKRH